MAKDDRPEGAGTDKKSYVQILREEIHTGTVEMRRDRIGLFLSGVSAGLDIGFSLLLMAVVLSRGGDSLHPLGRQLLLASMYSVGFIFVNLGRSELFTEHTTLMMFPTLHQHASAADMARVWSIVYVGNLVGAAAFAALSAFLGPVRGIIEPAAFGHIAGDLVESPWWVILLSAVLAGWMMGILSWLTTATKETMAQIACVFIITASIGVAGLHHCIAGSVEVLAGVFSGSGATLAEYGRFLLWATLGNIVGGILFASVKYAHATRGQEANSEREPLEPSPADGA